MFDQKSFLEELKEIRINQGISIYEMAELIGTSPSGVLDIERRNPTLRKLARYLEVLDLDLNDIFKE